MSDVGLGATLQLDIAEALGRIDTLAAQIAQVTTDVPTSLAEPDATPITSAIDQAVAAADTQVTPEADATEVTSAIDAAVDASDTTVPVDADTSAAAADIAGLGADLDVTVPVDADTSVAADQITHLADVVPDIIVPVEADTSAAEQEIQGLADVASAAGETIGGLTAQTQGFDAATSLAQGSTAGLVEQLAAVGGKTAVVTAGVAGTTAVLGALFNAGLDAVAVGERFDRTFGNLADSIENINVGTLNGDLGDLAVQLGDDDEALKQAAIRIGLFGTNAGAAAPEVANTTEQILALAISLKGANPALGESGDIANALPGALARGGRALQNFGIDLSSADINARALRDTGKTTAAELTVYEKSAAGAAIATERLSAGFGDKFLAGTNDPQVKIQALRQTFDELIEDIGRPLVEPITDFLTAITPLGIAVATTLGAVIDSLAPLIDLLALAGGPIKVFSDLVAALDPSLVGVVTGLLVAGAGIRAFAILVQDGVATMNPVLAGILVTLGLVLAGVSAFQAISGKHAEEQFAEDVKATTDALKDQAGQLDVSTANIAKYIQATSDFTTKDQIDDLERLGLSAEQVAILLQQGTSGLDDFVDSALRAGEIAEVFDDGLGNLTDSAGNAAKNTENLTKVGDRLFTGNTKLIGSFEDEAKKIAKSAQNTLEYGVKLGELDPKYVALAKSSGDYTGALKLAQQAQDDTAQSALNGEVASGKLTIAQRDAAIAATKAADGSTDYSAALKKVDADTQAAADRQAQFQESFARLAQVVPTVAQSYINLTTGVVSADQGFLNLSQTITLAKPGAEELQTIADGLGVSVTNLTGFVTDSQKAISDFVSDAKGKIPSLGDAFTSAQKKADDAKRTLTGKDILAGLNDTLKDITNYNTNLGKILGSAYSDLAGFAAEGGPKAVAAIAKSLDDKDHKTLDALRTNFEVAIPGAVTHAGELLETAAPEFLEKNGQIAALAAQYFGTGYTLPTVVNTAVVDATGKLTKGQEPFNTANTDLATKGTDFFYQHMKIGDVTGAAVVDATGRLVAGQAPLNTAAADGATQATSFFYDHMKIGDAAASGAAAAHSAIINATPGLQQVAGGAGTSTTTGYAGGLGGISGATVSALGFIGPYIQTTGVILAIDARAAGKSIGSALSDGIAQGIGNGVQSITNAAAAAVRAGEAAARKEAESHSPSLLFARIGRDLSLGMAKGLGDAASTVVDAAEQIVRDAAAASGQIHLGGIAGPGAPTLDIGVAPAVNGSGAGAGSSGPLLVIERIDVTVEVTGNATPEQARQAGADVIDGMADQLDRKFLADIRLSRKVSG